MSTTTIHANINITKRASLFRRNITKLFFFFFFFPQSSHQTFVGIYIHRSERIKRREEMMDQNSLPPHVLIFPLPAQGHINSMLKLAELLCLADIHVTFLVSANTKDSLIRFTNIQSRFDSYPGFRFETLPETFQEVSAHYLIELYNSVKAASEPFLSDLLLNNRLGSSTRRPVTTIIIDGLYSFLIDIAQQIGICIYYFRTSSSCAFWAYFSIKELIESHELPFHGMYVSN